jgi:hypothetical protein
MALALSWRSKFMNTFILLHRPKLAPLAGTFVGFVQIRVSLITALSKRNLFVKKLFG